MERGRKGEKYKHRGFRSRLIITRINDKYMNKEKVTTKMNSQLFSVSDVHWQEKICHRTLTMILKTH